MATELVSWGYTAWLTQRPIGYELSGYVEGREFAVVADTPEHAEREFSRAARRAWLRRKLRRIRGLPVREMPPVSTADTYHEISLVELIVAVAGALLRCARI
ncbi:hypothetical protein [Paraburkholderia dinghuensis]|uniref:Uncharacterized protein n=1 Tax=Paraburkholderia dinghuensis TaxID=2305225 RepID=A0A3N6MW26_9BURK|nr:hypothetical protein [Paraburkholderia dinghuensis]RQG99136.1 hypothetical protein D1Y85_26685 [Paraburkholderia dinghuensis]